MTLSYYKKNIIIVVVSFILFFVGFQWNIFHIMDNEEFYSFEDYSEGLVVGRLIQSQQDGVFSYGGLTGRVTNDKLVTMSSEEYRAYQYVAYLNEEHGFTKFNNYFSQTGGQAIVFGLIDNYVLFFIDNIQKINIFYIISSFFSALALSFVILWIYLELGFVAMACTLLGLIFSHHLIQFGKNLWWALYSFYIPLITILFFLRHFGVKKTNYIISYFKIFSVVVSVVCLKIFFTGYEYITTFVIMNFMPFIFYGLKDRWSLRQMFMVSGTFFVAVLTAALMGFLILSIQIAQVKGTFHDGVAHIIHSYTKRSSSTTEMIAQSSFANSVYEKSLVAPLSDVLDKYFTRKILYYQYGKIGEYIIYKNVTILFLIISVLLMVIAKFQNNRKYFAFGLMMLLSCLAPISWLVLFKGHSYIHSYMNVIVWYMPFFIFGYAGFGLFLSILWKIFYKKIKHKQLNI